HLDGRAGGDEQGHLDGGPGLHRGGLGPTGGAVALHTRVGLDDLQLDGGGHLDVERIALVGGHRGPGVLQQVALVVTDDRVRDGDLVVGVDVHEDGRFAVIVEVLHIA